MAGLYAEVVILAAWEQQLLTSVQRTDCTSFSPRAELLPTGHQNWLAGLQMWRICLA